MDYLAKCVSAIEAVLEKHGLVWENDDIADALEAAGIIHWNTVPKSGEIDAHFEGAEDLEPGDLYWTTTKTWADMVAASKGFATYDSQ
jgi:hypothetical protein